MSKAWPTKPLAEILQRTENVNPEAKPEVEFSYVDVSSVSNATFEITETQRLLGKGAPSRARKLIRKDDILFATIRPTLRRIAMVPEELDGQVCSTGYFVLRAKQGLEPRFLFHALFRDEFGKQMEKLQKGASYPAVTDGDVRAQSIPIPPLPEQRRIVGILDEAFAGIATAKANAEKNLQNARALFESHLHAVFTHRGPGWVEHSLEECIEKVRYTAKIQRKDFLETGRFPIVSQEAEFINGYWNNEGDVFRVAQPLVIFGDHTRTLKFIDFDFVLGADGVKLLLPIPSLDGKFFYYALLAAPIKSLGYARHYRLLSERLITFPCPLPEQRRITARLDTLQTETRRLEALYSRKLAALDELKAALLHQAFSGQL